MVCLVLFHRDLRMTDNTALINAAKSGQPIIPVFIFPPEQIDQKRNSYFSHPAVQFLCESLVDLNYQLAKVNSRIYTFRGDTVATLKSIHSEVPFESVYFNADYSVYAKERDSKVRNWCRTKNIEVHEPEDYDLVGIKEGTLPDGRPYTVLAQYYSRFQKDLTVRPVDSFAFRSNHFANITFNTNKNITIQDLKGLYNYNDKLAQRGGRQNGVTILKKLPQYKQYSRDRDFPAKDGTTKMSAHLKFGTISIREVYHKLVATFGKDHGLIRELVFRSFYLKIYTFQPKLQRGMAYRQHLDKNIEWKQNKSYWEAWVYGRTGYPLCDAGMRQLSAEGWVHNRVRMLVASVPTRYLLIDWRKASKYFYQHLVDADTFSNTAGWQWASGVGPDAAPYFRAPFNPFIQSKKFDSDAEYIKKYIPELSSVQARDIHNWDNPAVRAKYPHIKYPAPLIPQKEASHRSLELYKKAYTTLNR